MNILTTYVKNIVRIDQLQDGWYEVVCDTDCWGHKEYATTITVTRSQLESILSRGEYES